MAGVKKTKGVQSINRVFKYRGEVHRPVLVAVKKMFSNGYKKYISGKGVESDEVVKDAAGRPVPWRNINWD